MIESRRRLVLMALILIAFALRIWRLDFQSLWRDEVDAIYFAVRNLNETLSMFVQAAQNGPLYFLSLRPWFAVVGTSEFALRFPSVAAGTLSVPLVWQVGRRLLPSAQGAGSTFWLSTALLGTIFFALNPYQIWYGQEGKMYATVTCLALLSSWLWLRGIDAGGWRMWLTYLAVVSVAMYVHLLMVLLIPLHLAWFIAAWPVARVHWRGYGLALAGLTLPYLPMVWWHWMLLTSPEKLSGFNFTPLPTIVSGLALSHARGFITTVDLLWLTPVFFLFGAGVLFGVMAIDAPNGNAGITLHRLRRYILLLAWLVLPILFIYLLSLRQPVFTERYVIWIGPAAMFFVALGLRVLVDNSGRIAWPVAIVFLIYVGSLWTGLAWQQKVQIIKYDLRTAMQYVDSRRSPDELLILQIPHQEWAYRYYTSDFGPDPFAGSDERLGWWASGPYTNWGRADDIERAEVHTYLSNLTAGAGNVWVLLSEASMWDQRRLMDEWLATHGTLGEEKPFAGVTVRRYQIHDSDQ